MEGAQCGVAHNQLDYSDSYCGEPIFDTLRYIIAGMDYSHRQRAFSVLENVWIKRLTEQKERVDKTKQDWDLCFDCLLPGPARTRCLKDLLHNQGYGSRRSREEKKRRAKERRSSTERLRLSYVRELHVYRLLQIEIREIKTAREVLTE